MKKAYLFISLLAMVATSMQAQQKRLVLIEEFTNTGCGPCASWSPVLDSCINYRLGDCIAIKYHSGYPDRNDIYYNYDQEAHQAKVNFYNVTGVPTTFVDGQELIERSYAFLNQAVTYCQSQPVSFDLAISKQLDGKHLTVQASATPLSDIADASQVRLFVCAIEEHIESVVPYSNGERELYYTMRKMLTPADGTAVPAGLTAGESFTFTGSWTADFFDNLSELGVVAFLQNMATKEVLATAYSGPDAEGENRLTLQNLYDTPDLICTPNYYGKVIIRNDGANTITSAVLNVKVNDEVKRYPWTGSLDYLDRDTVVFDHHTAFQLNGDGKNMVEVWFTDINGSSDVSNTRTSQFQNSIQATYDVQLKIYTDKKPEETTWKLYDSAGNIVREGGPYDGMPRKFITVNFELTHDDCYQVEFLDAGGDGIKGSAGNGYYQLFQLNEQGKATRIAQGDYTGSVHDVFFNLSDTPAPSHRLVLFEEFTNTSCDPCAEFSPSFDKLIYERMGDMVAITYHYNFPSPQDPFYLANTTDVMARAGYYGISGVPSMWVNGTHVGAWGYEEYLDGYVDGAAEIAAKVNLQAEAEISADNLLTVNVSLLPLGITDGSNLRLFVAAVEERVEWDQPAANGERSWNYVMRKLLPDAQGQTLETQLTQVTPYEYTFTWPIKNYTDETELGLVTFVQNIATKEILGTAYTPRPNGHPQNAKLLRVENMPDRICSPEFACDLVVRNTGSETLTSATLNVSINGTVQQTAWTGSLDPLQIGTMRTPMFTDFALSNGKANDVELWLSNLNGQQVESVHKTFTLANAVSAQNKVRLTIMTDQKPEEITWTVTNSAGDVVCQGGPYTEARKKQVIDLPLDVDDCYLLEFEDEGGDGITGDSGRGYYMLHEVNAETGKARLLVQDTYTEALHDVYFSLQNATPTSIAVPYVALPTQQPTPAYDLMGRPATPATPLIIYKDKKIINNK